MDVYNSEIMTKYFDDIYNQFVRYFENQDRKNYDRIDQIKDKLNTKMIKIENLIGEMVTSNNNILDKNKKLESKIKMLKWKNNHSNKKLNEKIIYLEGLINCMSIDLHNLKNQ